MTSKRCYGWHLKKLHKFDRVTHLGSHTIMVKIHLHFVILIICTFQGCFRRIIPYALPKYSDKLQVQHRHHHTKMFLICPCIRTFVRMNQLTLSTCTPKPSSYRSPRYYRPLHEDYIKLKKYKVRFFLASMSWNPILRRPLCRSRALRPYPLR